MTQELPGLIDAADELRIPGTPWHLDAREPRTHCVVSHAHSDHIGRHQLVVATPVTCDLMLHRLGGEDPEAAGGLFPDAAVTAVVPLEYGRLHECGDVRIDLFPAGHVLGSAMARIQTPHGALLYTGDFRLRADTLTVPPCAPPVGGDHPRIDTLIMECTYGLPRYRMPPRQQMTERLCELIAGAQAEGKQPICLCYSLGKAQEIAKVLTSNGFGVAMHGAAYAISDIYQKHGVLLGPYSRYESGSLEGKVLIAPPHVRNSRMITRIANAEVFAITGWALDSSAKYRYNAQHAIPITDHADFDELVEFVQMLNPRLTLLTHGFAREMARELRDRGFSARPLRGPAQGSLFDL